MVTFPKGLYILMSGDRHTAQIPQRDCKVSSVPSGHLSIQGSAPTSKSRAPAQASVSSGQNRASCFQGNVLKWPMKGFLDIASPGKAIFSWLNYKWIRNIWSEFPLGFAKRTLDFILPKTFERWFRVFIEHGLAFPSFLFMLRQFRNRTTIS